MRKGASRSMESVGLFAVHFALDNPDEAQARRTPRRGTVSARRRVPKKVRAWGDWVYRT